MLLRVLIVFYLFIFFFIEIIHAQNKPDSSKISNVYKKIEVYSTKRKFTNLVHGFILKPVTSTPSLPQLNTGSPTLQGYSSFEGKIIRNINIITLDPFGYSVNDTSAHPSSFLEKTGNSLHVRTRQIAIRNRLLIHKNDRFDSLLVTESERLIRNQNYIHDVEAIVSNTNANSDSVDIYFRVSDLWSIVVDGGMSNERVNIKLSDKNLAGLGHSFSNSYTQNFVNGNHSFSTYYYVPNFINTYISTLLTYEIDEDKNFQKSLVIERPFFSPVTRWASGAFISKQLQPVWIYRNDTTRLFLTSKYRMQDYWAASAWQLFKSKTETDRTTKLIVSARVFNLKYLQKPLEQPDILDYYTNENLILTGVGISSRQYVKQSYIFRFGTPEDVPVGLAYGVVAGYQLKNTQRWYWGLRYSWGNLLKFGYFGTHFEYGTFINATKRSEGVLSLNINYFSNLFTIGNWKFRQFVKPELKIGMNRSPFKRLTLNDGNGLNGFNSDLISGTSRLLFVIQTQSYAPWNLLGFRFGPYLNCSFGMLGNESTGFRNSRIYPEFGIGVLVKNDFLVIKYFQFSFAFYPSIPGNGKNIFKANPFRTTDFGFQDFIIGKPEVIEFN